MRSTLFTQTFCRNISSKYGICQSMEIVQKLHLSQIGKLAQKNAVNPGFRVQEKVGECSPGSEAIALMATVFRIFHQYAKA